MSWEVNGGNTASTVTERVTASTLRCYINRNLPQVPNTYCPTAMDPSSNILKYGGGILSSDLLKSQIAELTVCNYQKDLALAKARGKVPEPCPPVKSLFVERRVPIVRCATPQEDINVGVAKPVDTCFNIIGISQLRIN
jgi:hypothetical protein